MSFELPIPPLPEPEHYSYLRLRAEQVATFVNSPDANEMLASGTMNPLRAVVLRAVMATPGLPGFLYEHIGAPGYRRAGFDILGIGYHAITVSDGHDMVKKYYRRTAGATESFQSATIEAWQAKQALVLEHLGAYAVPQVFSIDENPLNHEESIVTASQARVSSISTVNMFRPDEIPAEARSFLQESQTMYQNAAPTAVPDLIGKNNVLIDSDTNTIKLIDPIALVRDDPTDESGYHRVTTFLDTYLDAGSHL